MYYSMIIPNIPNTHVYYTHMYTMYICRLMALVYFFWKKARSEPNCSLPPAVGKFPQDGIDQTQQNSINFSSII